MNCEQMSLLLSAWLDGEITQQEEVQMRAHLEQCPDCRALMEQLQMLHTSFSELEEIPAPEGFADKVMERVAREGKPRVVPLFKRPQIRALTAMAACAVLCIGFGRISMGGSAKSEAAPAPEAAMAPRMEAAEPESAYEYSTVTQDMFGVEEKTAAGEMPAEAPAAAPPQSVEPAAPAPEMSVQMDAAFEAESRIELERLPDGLEDAVGQLRWEERIEDGALCARLTADQAETVLELIGAQGVEGVIVHTPGVGEGHWLLVLLPN